MKVKKVESTIRPSNFRIGDIKDNLTEVVFFDDIEEVKRTTTDGTEETIYTYYEYAIKIISRDDLEDYINELAKQSFIASKAAEIRAIRDKLLSESDKHVLIDRLGITIPDNITATSLLSVIKELFSSLGDVLNGQWATYRQELRDITKQKNFPFEVEFPTIPEEDDGSK